MSEVIRPSDREGNASGAKVVFEPTLPQPGAIEYLDPNQKRDYSLLEEISPTTAIGTDVAIQTKVSRVKKNGGVSFVVLEGIDPSLTLQTTVQTPKGDERDNFNALGIKKGSVVRVKGSLQQRPQEAQLSQEEAGGFGAYELQARPQDITIISQPEVLPAGLRWEDVAKGKNLTAETYGEILRMPEFRRILLLRESVKSTFLNHFNDRGFRTIDVPALTGSISESGAEVFRVLGRAGDLSLIQSPQQIKQIMAGLFGKVVWTGQAFRNDPSITAHHLAEFTGLDMEMQIQQDDKSEGMRAVMYELQEVVRTMLTDFEANPQVFKDNNASLPVMAEKGIPVIDFKSAMKIAGAQTFNRDAEKKVADHVFENYGSEFYFVTGFPDAEKPFYTDVKENDPEYTYSFDLVFRGVEIASGGLRIPDVNLLRQRLIQKGYNPENFQAYLDNFARGTAPTGGFGIGLERFIARNLGGINVRLTTPFPKNSELILG